MILSLHHITQIDHRCFLWINQRRLKDQAYRLTRVVSHCGDGYLYLLAGMLILWLDPLHGQNFFVDALYAFGIELPLYLLLKNTIRRNRPAQALQGFESSHKASDKFSFPSGHAAAAFVFATLIAVYYPLFAAPVFLLAAMIGASRVLLGVHFPSDILAGALLGFGSAMMVISSAA